MSMFCFTVPWEFFSHLQACPKNYLELMQIFSFSASNVHELFISTVFSLHKLKHCAILSVYWVYFSTRIYSFSVCFLICVSHIPASKCVFCNNGSIFPVLKYNYHHAIFQIYGTLCLSQRAENKSWGFVLLIFATSLCIWRLSPFHFLFPFLFP